MKSGFKRTLTGINIQKQTTQNAPNWYLNFSIYPSFQGVNRLFVLPFNGNDNRKGHSRYYLSNAKVKDYNVVIDWENFFDRPIKSYIKTYEDIPKITVGQGDDFANGCLLDYNYFKKKKKKNIKW